MTPARVIVLRGTSANPWDLRPWEELRDEFDITVVVPANNEFDVSGIRLRKQTIRTAGAMLGGAGALGRMSLRAVGERYIGLADVLTGADIVHSAELGTWHSAQAAALRRRLGFGLAVTVWETLPFITAYRNVRTRAYRRRVLAGADLFLAATERARAALLLEGADPSRIRVSPPGVPPTWRADAHGADEPGGSRLILSIGRLVWEKGHQDVLRALAVLRARGERDVRVLIVGVGPEERRLRRAVDDLGLGDVVEMRGWVAHDQLQAIYAQASCLVLASQATWYWEEQFGMVLVEAMAAGLPVCASSSGAIPEVLAGGGTLFSPGDWLGLAGALQSGPLKRPADPRVGASAALLKRYSAEAAAARLKSAYRELLTPRGR